MMRRRGQELHWSSVCECGCTLAVHSPHTDTAIEVSMRAAASAPCRTGCEAEDIVRGVKVCGCRGFRSAVTR